MILGLVWWSPRLIGGLLAAGAGLIVTGFYEIAADLWPDGAITTADFLMDVRLFLVPGLIAMGVGARVLCGSRGPTRPTLAEGTHSWMSNSGVGPQERRGGRRLLW